jgi:hypothetical protein
MSNNEHSITPPDELMQGWLELPISLDETLVIAARSDGGHKYERDSSHR